MMNAHGMPFSKIISSDQGAHEHYHMPKYQREYTWGKWDWERLLQDIDENDPGYFMGSLICVKDGEPLSPGDSRLSIPFPQLVSSSGSILFSDITPRPVSTTL